MMDSLRHGPLLLGSLAVVLHLSLAQDRVAMKVMYLLAALLQA
jgi:hypothetical protein